MKKTITSLFVTLSLSFCSIIPGIDTMDGYTAKKKLLNAANSIDRISVGIVTGSAASSTIVNMINTIVLPAIISIDANKYYDKASVQDCVSKINSITGLILGGATTLPLCDIKEASFIDIGPIDLINGKKAEVNDALAFLLLFGGGSDSGTATGTGTGSGSGTSTGTGTGTSTGTGTGTSTGTGTGTSSTPAACTTSGAADGTIQQLSFSVVDAEYDLVNNRIVLVDSSSKFHYYNPSTNADSTLTLNFAPLNVTVSPDGTKAAVGHDANATLINLPGTTLAREVATAIKANDVAMNNTYVYISSSNQGSVKSVTFADGTINNHTGISLNPPYLAHNSTGNSLYLIDTAVSPVDIRKINTAANPPTYLYDSIYHGDYSMCGPIWLAKDSSKTFNSCLTAFTVSAVQASDIQYAGAFSSTTFLRIQHLNTDSSQIFFIPTNLYFSNSTFSDGTKVSSEYIYRHGLTSLSFISKKTLPCYTSAGKSYKTEGKFVFVNSSSTEYYVIVKPDANSGNVNDQIIKFPY